MSLRNRDFPDRIDRMRRPGRPAIHGGQWGGLRFRCLYCRTEYKDKGQLSNHEAMCDARFIVERGWRVAIERAREAESRQR